MKKILAALLTTSLLSTSSLLAADESAASQPQPLRASIDRAVALAVATDASAPAPPAASVAYRSEPGGLATAPRAARSEGQMAAGGGGGHAMAIVWTLVGTAASVGATVYYMKYMRKTMADAAAQK